MGRRKEVTTYICIFIVMLVANGCISSKEKENSVAIMAEDSMTIVNDGMELSADHRDEKVTVAIVGGETSLDSGQSDEETTTDEISSKESTEQTTQKKNNSVELTTGLNKENSTGATQNQKPIENVSTANNAKPGGSPNTSSTEGHASSAQNTGANGTTVVATQTTQTTTAQSTTEEETDETTTQPSETVIEMRTDEVVDDSGNTEE